MLYYRMRPEDWKAMASEMSAFDLQSSYESMAGGLTFRWTHKSLTLEGRIVQGDRSTLLLSSKSLAQIVWKLLRGVRGVGRSEKEDWMSPCLKVGLRYTIEPLRLSGTVQTHKVQDLADGVALMRSQIEAVIDRVRGCVLSVGGSSNVADAEVTLADTIDAALHGERSNWHGIDLTSHAGKLLIRWSGGGAVLMDVDMQSIAPAIVETISRIKGEA